MGPELILQAIGGTLWLSSFGLLTRLAQKEDHGRLARPDQEGHGRLARPNQEGHGRLARCTIPDPPPASGGPPEPLLSRLSIIIPARNEAHNLPRLLDSIFSQPIPPLEVLVVDDASTDATASVATAHGATVVSSLPLPDGWRGKPWACHQGALATKGELLLFLDADCWFEPGGLDRILSRYHSALSRSRPIMPSKSLTKSSPRSSTSSWSPAPRATDSSARCCWWIAPATTGRAVTTR